MPTRITKGVGWLPFANFVLLACTLIVSYSISESRDLVSTPLPFISDTGTFPPASCWFSFLLNATAYSVAFTGLIRYLQTREYIGVDASCTRCFNFLSLLLILCGSVSLSMVASFQETNNTHVHTTSATVAFSCATAYAFLQEGVSGLNSKAIYYIRVILLSLAFCGLILMQTFYDRAGINLPQMPSDKFATTLPPFENETYYYIATSSEWAMSLSLFTFLLTFSYEFSRVDLSLDVHYDGYTPINWNML
ncbi:DNA damage-regulated autophagy modulator protein 2-like isoform X2 [Convolutriloba macropyga]|uniref:DNA damage-regulated autophagy modulator protein 2-like isoform X2 n=1 Tax=Convolutriloba macropyga TaxID=536237 RepID=UPI003F5264A4